MALYNPDYQLINARKVIDALDINDERDKLIKYYCDKEKEHIKKLQAQIKEYNDFFNTLGKFIPQCKSPTVYG